jgi:hypothetical protein
MSGAGRVTDNPPHGSQTGAARHSGHVVLRLAQRHTHDAESLRDMPEIAVAYHESAVVEAAPGFEDAGDNPYFHEQVC